MFKITAPEKTKSAKVTGIKFTNKDSHEKKGLPAVDNQVIYMVLGFVFPLILLVLVQSEINKLTDESI